MRAYEECCVVCGEPSATLFCAECETLLRTSALRAKAVELPEPVAAAVGTDD